MDVSVVIPTRGRPDLLRACIQRLAEQALAPDRFEILVGVDGPDEATERAADAAQRALRSSSGPSLHVHRCPRSGIAGVKSLLIGEARGRFLLFINDDVLAEPGFIEAHLRAHEVRTRAGRSGAMILGDSPWLVREPDRLFDRLIRETSMIFFYSEMPKSGPGYDPERDWGFRHAWHLNLSVSAEAVRAVGGFATGPLRAYGYEDLELAWRLQQEFEMPVLYRPDAVAWHDHPYEPDQYLARERELGRQARALAMVSPGCALAVFGRDVTSDEELEYSRMFVEREAIAAERLLKSFRSLADLPATSVASGAAGAPIIRLLYEQHLLLKRYVWRQGLIAQTECVGAA